MNKNHFSLRFKRLAFTSVSFLCLTLFSLQLNAQVPFNNDCGNAVDLTPGTTNTSGTVFHATASPGVPVGCATGNADDDVWYKFTAVAGYATVTLHNISNDLTNSGAMVQLFSGGCGSFLSVVCGRGVITASGLISGNVYFLRVYSSGTGQAGFSSGSFSISVTPSASKTFTAGRMKEMYSQTILSAPQVLNNPWEVTLGPDDNLWITESKGYRLYKMNSVTSERDTVLDISRNSTFLPLADRSFNMQFDISVNNPQGGFAGMALHPKFLDAVSPQNYVYVSYVHTYLGLASGSPPTGIIYTNRIVRFTYNTATGKLESPVSLCDTLPGSSDHNSQRMIIAPVGGTDYLFYAAGDMGAGQFDNHVRPNKAQLKDAYEGKILRFNLESDGDVGVLDKWIPNDNPYANSVTGKVTAVWATGIRNNQGFAYNSTLDVLYGASHGPYSDDEINIIDKDKNYGHPYVVGYAFDNNYNGVQVGTKDGSGISSGSTTSSCPIISSELVNAASILNYKDPMYSAYAASNAVVANLYNNPWGTTGSLSGNARWLSEAWAGLDLYQHTLIPGWKNSLVAAGLKWGRLIRMKLDATGTMVMPTAGADTVMYLQSVNRYRDLALSSNGKDMYVIMDKLSATSGPTTGSSVVNACPGCVHKYTFLGYADAAGKSTIPSSIDVTQGTANSCTNGTTITIDDENSNWWVPITGPDGNIMAEINANGQTLGTITSSFYTNTNAIRIGNSVRYLDRNITITPQFQPSSPVKIRLYFSKEEYDALDLDPMSGVTAIGDLKILKNADLCGGNIALNTTLIAPTYAEAFGANGYLLQADITGFSSFYFAAVNIILPFKLVQFSGNFNHLGSLLKWDTEYDVNSKYFELERSINGKEYTTVAKINAKNSGGIKNAYSYIDVEATKLDVAIIRYRLKIVHNDGALQYSNIVVINIGNELVAGVSVYPNPAKTDVLLTVTTDVNQKVSVQVIDNAGRIIIAKENMLQRGVSDIVVDLSTLWVGNYFIKVTGATINSIQKLQKQ